MKRKQLIFLGAALLSAVAALDVTIGKDVPSTAKKGGLPTPNNGNAKAAQTPKPKQVEDGGTNQDANGGSQKPADQPISAKRADDEEAIRLTGETFVKAYDSADANAVAAHYTPDAEYIDEEGNVFQGRKAIEEAIAACFVKNPGAQMEMNIVSIRFVSPGVAVEDGNTIVRAKGDQAQPIETRYTAVHVKFDGKWLTASVREQAPKDRRQHRIQLQQLDWLRGDWVDEGDEALVVSSCTAVNGGNFLLREYKIHIGGQEATNGTQRIGWDPLTGKLKSWVFDSEGGYSEGFWHRDDDRWVLKSSGVTSDGQPASSTTIYTLVSDDTMTWQSVNHEIAGVEIPDSDVVTIVRRAPPPQSADDALTSQSK